MAKPKVKLFALSTCGWCRKAKEFLKNHEVECEIVEVDLLEGEEKEKCLGEVKKYNPRISFPTVIIGEEIIIGFDEEKLKKALKL